MSGHVVANLCGNGFIQSTYISSSAYFLVRFHSDDATSAQGFRLQFQTTVDVGECLCVRQSCFKLHCTTLV